MPGSAANATSSPSMSAPFLGRCSVLLGPGGAGKSTTLQARKAFAPRGVPVEHVDLTTLACESLADRLLEAPAMQRWRKGSAEVCLVVDSFDEALQRRTNLAQEFEGLLSQWPTDRLWLRIACRSADWPAFLDESLAESFSGDVTMWQLLPLTLKAIRQIAERAGVDGDAFVTAVVQQQVGPLAATPMTLQLLLATYKSSGGLPGSTWGLYEQGLLAMTEERSDRRRHAVRHDDSRPTSRKIVRVASQVAAAMTFAGHPQLWTSSESTAPPRALTSESLLDVLQSAPGGSSVTRSDLEHVLGSALCRPQGRASGWSHSTVREHLAAAWVCALDDEDIRSLLLADDGRLFPQTSRIAAWLVLADVHRFAWLATADPAAVVGHLDIPDAGVRADVVGALLRQVADGAELRRWGVDYRYLKHPGLGAQLIAYLDHPAADARLLAIDIARQLRPAGLGVALTRIALDHQEPVHVRARAIIAAGERDDAGELTMVFERPAADDDFDELIGAGILACWPRWISTGQALRRLSAAHPRVNVMGNLDVAAHEIAQRLTADDVDVAAEFLLSADPEPQDGHMDAVIPAAFALCADHLDVDRAAEACTTLVIQRLRAGLTAVPASLDGTLPGLTAPRRLALLVICAAGPDDPVQLLMMPASFGGLITPDDRDWLLAQAPRVHPRDPRVFERFRLPVDEGTAGATPPAAPPPSQMRSTAEYQNLIEEALDRCEADPADAFLDVSWLVSGRDVLASSSLGAQSADLSQRPGWSRLTPSQRGRFLDAAERYVAGALPSSPAGVSADRRRRSEEGVRALVTLAAQRADVLDELAPATWRRWGEPLVRWSWGLFGMSLSEKTSLVERALPHARDVMEGALLAAVESAATVDEPAFIDVESRLLWSEAVLEQLLGRLETGLPPRTHVDVARLLLQHAPPRVRSLLAAHCRDASDEVAAASAVALLRFDGEASGSVFTDLVANRPAVLRQAVSIIGPLSPGQAPKVDPAVASVLIVWLMSEAGATSAGTLPRPWRRDDVFSEWAGHFAEALRADASAAAVAALERTADALANDDGIRHSLLITRAAHRTQSWTPIPPGTLLAWPERKSRPFRSAADLRNAVVATLAEVQQLLSGEGGEAPLLWDTSFGRPKGEEQVTNYLANRLRERLGGRGVVVQPEAQLRRPGITGIGYRTDLRLDVSVGLATSQRQLLTVMIEVKGAWHEDLMTGLEDQLVGRYLSQVPGAHGVYVVLWPDPQDPMWTQPTGKDSRRYAVARRHREEVLAELRRRAEQLSQGMRTVEIVIVDLSTTA